MTTYSDMFDHGIDTLLAVAGNSVSYKERGESAQSATALEQRLSAPGDDVVVRFTFAAADLTVSSWRGAEVTGSDTFVYVVQDRSTAPGIETFVGVRAAHRS